MKTSDQYEQDSEKLAALIETYTGIPKKRTFQFVMENAAAELLPCANVVCETDAQREKLSALFEFKNLYETVKRAEPERAYRISGAEVAMEYFKTYYEDKNDKERVSVAFLDSQLRIIATKTMFSGTVDQSFLSDREIVKEALFHNAASAMLAHNHPGGSDTPSQADVTHTKRIQQALEAVGVRLLDHIIVAGDTAASLAADGYISVSSKVETKKYEFTGTGKNSRSVVLRQIRALRNFGSVKVGDLGGFIEKEDNLSHGGNAWVGGNAQVSGHAQISGNAQVFGNAKVSGHAKVFDNAMICDDVRIFDHAKVYHDAWIFGKTRIGGDRTICSPDDLAHELSENRGDLTSRTKRDRAQGAPKKTVEERSR